MERILEDLPEKVYAVDLNRKIIFANKSLLSSCGLELNDLLGRTCSDIPGCCPLTDADGACPHEEVINSGRAVTRRYVSHTPDGNKQIMEINASPFHDTNGDVKGISVVLRDVTEAVQLEEILERYAEGLTILFELSTVFLTTSGTTPALNQSLTHIANYYNADFTLVLFPGPDVGRLEAAGGTGWDEGGLEGLTVENSKKFIAGFSFLEKCPAIVPDFSKDTRFQLPQLMEDYGVRSGMSVPMVAEDRAFGVLCILYKQPRPLDTAELWYLNVAANSLGVYLQKERSLENLQRSESFVSSVLEAIGEGVVVVGPDLRILSANKEYLKIAGMEDENVVGKYCYEVSHKQCEPCYEHGEECTVKDVFETGRRASALHTHYRKDGTPVYVQTHSYPVTDALGNVSAAVETIMDVTEKVKLEKDLEKRVRELEEFYDMAVGRELRMIELKEEIEQLRAELAKHKSQP